MPRDQTPDDMTNQDDEAVAVGPGTPAFRWDARRDRAAYLMAEDELTNTAIAEEVGVSRNTLDQWRRRPEFASRVTEHILAIAEGVVTIGVARKRYRLNRDQMLLDRMEMVMTARASVAKTDQEKSGLIVRKPVYSPDGDLTWELKFDGALVQQYRATMEHAAKELGQLNEKIEITTETMTRRYEGVNVEAV